MIIAKYKFDSNTDTIPSFNSGFSYTVSDVDNGDNTTTRTIESDADPTSITFQNSSGLKEVYVLDVSSKITNLSNVFANCTSLTFVNTFGWDTSNVTSLNCTFINCRSLTSLDLSTWNTSKVQDMSSFLARCSELTHVDMSNWNTVLCTNLVGMFTSDTKLKYIGLLYADKATCEDISSLFPYVNGLQRVIYVSDTSADEYVGNDYITFNDYEIQNRVISIPQPLRKNENYSDRLYWNDTKGRYCIEQNVGSNTTIETDITEKIAFNTYTSYAKIVTDEKEIEPSSITVQLPINEKQ